MMLSETKMPKQSSKIGSALTLPSPSTDAQLKRQQQRCYTLQIPTAKDFASLCELQDLAFPERRGWCQPISDCRLAYQRAYMFYAQKYPSKLQHCRIIYKDDDNEESDDNKSGNSNGNKRTIIGACQVQLPGDPGDMSFCADGMHPSLQHTDRHAYIEWIACHPDYNNQRATICTQLLKWAVDYCRSCKLTKLCVQVPVGSDKGEALALYETMGFVKTSQPGDDCMDVYCLAPFYAFCCLGFQYWSLEYMEVKLRCDDGQGDITHNRLPSFSSSSSSNGNEDNNILPITRKAAATTETSFRSLHREEKGQKGNTASHSMDRE